MTVTTELIRFQTDVLSKPSPEAVYDVLADLESHLEWAGRRSRRKGFRLVELDAPATAAMVGTQFSSLGDNGNAMFHDTSVVTEAARPGRFAFGTDSRLARKHRADWHAHFTHRYAIEAAGAGSRISYVATCDRASYRPYWLQPGVRRLTRSMVTKMMKDQLSNLAGLAEERSTAGDTTSAAG
jgi:hypothetical protein